MSINLSELSNAVAIANGFSGKVSDSKKVISTKQTTKSYRTFNKVKDSISYLSLKKRIKDALSETETTDEAIQAIEQIAQDKPADVVIPAVVEVLGETIDILESAIDSSSISVSTDFDEDGIDDKTELESDIEPEDELESEISDSRVQDQSYALGDTFDNGEVQGTIVDVKFNDDDVTLTLDVTDANGDVTAEFVNVSYEELGI